MDREIFEGKFMKNNYIEPKENEIFIDGDNNYLLLEFIENGWEDIDFCSSFWSAIFSDGTLGIIEISAGDFQSLENENEEESERRLSYSIVDHRRCFDSFRIVNGGFVDD